MITHSCVEVGKWLRDHKHDRKRMGCELITIFCLPKTTNWTENRTFKWVQEDGRPTEKSGSYAPRLCRQRWSDNNFPDPSHWPTLATIYSTDDVHILPTIYYKSRPLRWIVICPIDLIFIPILPTVPLTQCCVNSPNGSSNWWIWLPLIHVHGRIGIRTIDCS